MTNQEETKAKLNKKTSAEVQELYTERASFYDRFFIDFLGWGRELEAFFRRSDYLRSNMKILDAGCGTGIITKTLNQLVREKGYEAVTFHAFDLTESMLEIFRQWAKAQAAENIELRQADVLEIESLPSDWKEYDLVVSSTMLEYLPKDRVKDALVNLKRLVKKGGKLLVFITKRSFVTNWLAGKWWKTNTYEMAEVEKVFREAGFEKVEFRSFSSTSWWSNYILVIEAEN